MEAPDQILARITETTERIVSSEGFVNKLAAAISNKLAARDPYPNALSLAEIANGKLIAQPRRTASGKMVLLSQIPARGGINVSVVVLAKDSSLVGQPTQAGMELVNYTLAMYHEKMPGDLHSRTPFVFDPASETDLQDEFFRQLKTLPLRESAYFFVNIITVPASAAQTSGETPATVH